MSHFLAIPSTVTYYRNLHIPSVVHALRYRFKAKAIIYGFRCQPTGMMYIGSTLAPSLRFSNHLESHTNSNDNLQDAIIEYGQSKFTAYVFEVVIIPKGLSLTQAKTHLAKIEQTYINHFPKDQLFNINKASL